MGYSPTCPCAVYSGPKGPPVTLGWRSEAHNVTQPQKEGNPGPLITCLRLGRGAGTEPHRARGDAAELGAAGDGARVDTGAAERHRVHHEGEQRQLDDERAFFVLAPLAPPRPSLGRTAFPLL